MDKGILYIMTTIVPGLIKIGQTNSEGFNTRMYDLETNGYKNITGLKRCFAIMVDDYKEKEKLLHTVFQKSRVGNTELFSVDKDLAVQLLSSFEGEMVYPDSEGESKEDIFNEVTDISRSKLIPNGIYTLTRWNRSDNKEVKATARVDEGFWTILKGSKLAVKQGSVSKHITETRDEMPIDKNGVLINDYELNACSPSYAADIVAYVSTNGWEQWKDINGEAIDKYRKEIEE